MEEENKIMLTNLNSIDDSNTRNIRSEQARLVHQNFNNNKVKLLQICIANILMLLEVRDQICLNISIVTYIKLCSIFTLLCNR